jgi:hypothetical protein
MDWACGYDGGDKECIENFCGETSWKMPTWKIEDMGE